jgi:hypothetical protein
MCVKTITNYVCGDCHSIFQSSELTENCGLPKRGVLTTADQNTEEVCEGSDVVSEEVESQCYSCLQNEEDE